MHLGQETQDLLSQDLWKKVTNQLNFTLDNEDIELELGKDFDLDWVDGRGVIKCINENTVDIFIKMIQDFKIKGLTFRGWRPSTPFNDNQDQGQIDDHAKNDSNAKNGCCCMQ